MADEATPDTLSGDMAAMAPYWATVTTILDGSDAIKAAGKAMLPKFANEADADYNDRLDGGKFSNIFRDIVENLASKPFAKQVDFVEPDTVSKELKSLAEDIDGQGDHLHVFAGTTFFYGIANGIDWILVDKTPVREGATLAEERAAGARPYWVRISAADVVAVYSAMIDGKEQFVHFRYLEPEVKREAYGEQVLRRVRVLNREPIETEGKITGYAPATWQLLEQRQDPVNKDKVTWVQIDAGAFAIGVIPLVPFRTGRRKGSSWQLLPPMKDASHLQIKHYQAETNLEYAKGLTAAPMLSGEGVSPPMEAYSFTDEQGNVRSGERPARVPVGPKTVLYAPANSEGKWGGWKYVEISAEGLKFLADEIERTEQQLREIGRQPILAQAGITVITAANASQKASSVLQAWVLGLKDALWQAMVFTGMWLGNGEAPQVFVFTDFALDRESDKAPDFLLKLRENGDISRKTILREGERRGYLSDTFDEEADMLDILAEVPGEDDDEEVKAALPGDLESEPDE